MIPATFEYHAPTSIREATALLARLGDDAKVLSGGQSLIPLMKLRLASPKYLVDINGLPGLDTIAESDGFLRIGGLCRESDLEESELIRTRYPLILDTAGSSPIPWCATWPRSAATWPTAIRPTTIPRPCWRSAPRWWPPAADGERAIPIADFFTGLFATALRSRRDPRRRSASRFRRPGAAAPT